jgi:hypothetical protein
MDWAIHRPFILNVHQLDDTLPKSIHPTNPHESFSTHLSPFGSTLPVIDKTETLRVCMQNTRFAFSIYGECIDIYNIIANLTQLDAHLFAPISPNTNCGNHSRTCSLFRKNFSQVHLSATSSDIGLHKEYINKSIVGGAAILSFSLWASKVSQSWSDPSGMGTFTKTTISGKQNRKISFISAYIAVMKGLDVGIDSMYAQQTTLYERNALLLNKNQQILP